MSCKNALWLSMVTESRKSKKSKEHAQDSVRSFKLPYNGCKTFYTSGKFQKPWEPTMLPWRYPDNMPNSSHIRMKPYKVKTYAQAANIVWLKISKPQCCRPGPSLWISWILWTVKASRAVWNEWWTESEFVELNTNQWHVSLSPSVDKLMAPLQCYAKTWYWGCDVHSLTNGIKNENHTNNTFYS